MMPNANLPLKLLRLQRPVDRLEVLVEHAVRRDLAGGLGAGSRVHVDGHQRRQHQEHDAEPQLDGDRVECDPKEKVDQIGHVVQVGTGRFGGSGCWQVLRMLVRRGGTCHGKD